MSREGPKSGDVYVTHNGSSVFIVINAQDENELKGLWVGTNFRGKEEKVFAISPIDIHQLIKNMKPVMNIDAGYFRDVILEKYKDGEFK